ncbi:Nuclear transport factor 2 [Apophysomyces sp. BC1034]|nr:Nuclear transport factor 2 [Apophysomyces sp. BC1015]KAG0180045.1 Nuclear transport factor 2 [Apophysomyces sp. BC1021]KAG0191827.1 Nuclear transport factor 2 [Apophysomyces sp. BC1034]
MADFTTIASQFVNFYYQTFDADRNGLAALYRNQSMLTFEGQQTSGVTNIVEKLVSLPFAKVAHKVTTIDAQPSTANGSIIVIVTGVLLIDEEQNPQMFSQTFQLVPEGGSYYVFNDIFRLNYGV